MTTTTEPCYDVNADTREGILLRLAQVLSSLPGLVGFARNDGTIPDTQLPWITMLDGDEDIELGRDGRGPQVVTLNPEVYLTIGNDDNDQTGLQLAEWELAIKTAVLNDSTLQQMVHSNSIRYYGNQSATAPGRQMVGQMSMEFGFDYALRLLPPCVPQPDGDDPSAPLRDRILRRLMLVAATTEGVASVARNEATQPDDPVLYPRVLLLDGEEVSDPSMWGRGRPPNGPNKAIMSPELYVILQRDAEYVGPDLNRVRLMLLRGFLTDPVLAALALDRDIRYGGCETAFAAGRTLVGEMGFTLNIARLI